MKTSLVRNFLCMVALTAAQLAWAADPGEVGIDSGSGEITLTFPSASGATVDLESSSGDISSDFEITTTRIERDTLRGTFGDGKGRIAVETGSGATRNVTVADSFPVTHPAHPRRYLRLKVIR